MTPEQHQARLAVIKEALDNSTKELEKVQRAGRSVPKTTSSTFSQPKPTVSNARVHPINKPPSFPPPRPAKRNSEVIDVDTSDDIPPPRKIRKTSSGQTAGGATKPWDQDHSKMKKPPRVSLARPESSTSSSGKNKTRFPRASIKAQIELSAEQRGVLQLVLQGQSIFFTGSAGEATKCGISVHLIYSIGTGKSVLLRRIISEMKIKYSKVSDPVAVTAPTGIAACNIGGVTVHSFGGIGLGNGTALQLATKIRKQQKVAARWHNTKVLIIDEGEMSSLLSPPMAL
jgi:hypothetical protein